MARVQIRLPEEYQSTAERGGLVPSKYYQILVDGQEVKHLTGVDISWDVKGVPTAKLSIYVEDLEIDALALANLKLHLVKKEGVSKICAVCGKPFMATHGRMRYCPPPEGAHESHCSRRARYEAQKARKAE